MSYKKEQMFEKELSKKRESSIESDFRKAIEQMGGLCLKFISPGHAGVPDRIVFLPGGKLILVELKTTTGRPSAQQLKMQRTLQSLGFKSYIVYGADEVQALLEDIRCGCI